MMKIVLLNPPSNLIQRGEHLGLGYLAAVLRRAGHEVEIVDAFLREQNICEVLAILNDRSFDLLGVTINAANLSPALTLSQIVALGDERCRIVFGGIQATLCYETLLQNVPWLDWVVLGEGERTLVELVNCLDGDHDWRHVPGLAYRQGDRVITTPPRKLISDLDELPFPARDLLDEAKSRGWSCYISSSRGCHWQCSFCAIRAAYRFTPGKRWRARSIQNTVDEMETLYWERGITDFYFVDDNFLGPGKRGKERARLLAQEILRRGIRCKLRLSCRASDVDRELFSLLKEAGLVEVFIGVESGVERALGTFNKGISVQGNVQALTILTDLRIKSDVGFILLDPFTAVEEIAENLAFLKQFDGAYVCMHNVTASLEVHEGTPIQTLLASQGLLTGSPLDWQYQAIDPRVETLRRLVAKRKSSPLKLLMSIWRVKEQVSEGSLLELELNGLLREIQQVEIGYAEQMLNFARGDFQGGDPASIEEDTRSNLHRIGEEFGAIAAEFNFDSALTMGEMTLE
jgi:anaerobic magnesium-protoporphyrin IX monomethyl ester cyclase